MTPRRMRGEGGVTRRADGRWQATLELGFDATGKRRRRTIYGKTQREAVQKLAQERRKLEQAGAVLGGATPLHEYLTHWLERTAPQRVKPKTLTSYESILRVHVTPRIGRLRLDKIQPQHVRTLTAEITAATSSSTALKAHAVLSKALTDAVREGVLLRNPAEMVDRPRANVPTRRALSPPDAARLLATVARDADAARWGLALLTGMRQGECLGLTWEHLDLDAGTVTVAWQLQRVQYVHGCGGGCGARRAADCPDGHPHVPSWVEHRHLTGGLFLVRPKSRKGWRRFPLVEPMLGALRAHPVTANPWGLVFTDGGQPIDPRRDSARWHANLERAGLPSSPLHTARHTTATLLKVAGVDDLTIMSILGHSAASTMHGYVTQDEGLQVAGLQRLAGLLGTGPNTVADRNPPGTN